MTAPLIDEGQRWAPGDWLHEPTVNDSFDCAYRVLDAIDARAAGDNARMGELCSRQDVTTPQLARTALHVLGSILRTYGGERMPEWLSGLRAEVVHVAAAHSTTTARTDRMATSRLEALAIAEQLLQANGAAARELACGSDLPPFAHLVSAVVLLERMSKGPHQREALDEFRALVDWLRDAA
jgi:hypothetical protein